MKQKRTIRKIVTSSPTLEGAGVHLNRVFGFGDTELYDPFLLLDDFRSDTPEHYLKGFPWHPHRGIETITYVLRGDVEHGDSLGNKGLISSGDVQWMTAGSGIIHQEMPQGDGSGAMHGFQLWANLPAAQKMMAPRYRDIKARDIPEVILEKGIRIKVIAGSVKGVKGPMEEIIIDPEYLDCSVPKGERFTRQTPQNYTTFLYVIGGSGMVDGRRVKNGQLVLFSQGDFFEIRADDKPLRFLFICGKPLKEKIAWRGPIVMNSEEELEIAFREYQEGTFIKF